MRAGTLKSCTSSSNAALPALYLKAQEQVSRGLRLCAVYMLEPAASAAQPLVATAAAALTISAAQQPAAAENSSSSAPAASSVSSAEVSQAQLLREEKQLLCAVADRLELFAHWHAALRLAVRVR